MVQLKSVKSMASSKQLGKREFADHFRNGLIAALNCIPVIGGPAGTIADKYLPDPQIHRLFKSVEGLQGEMAKLKQKDQTSMINCLSSGWDMSMLDSIWLEHRVPINFSIKPLKDQNDWDSRIVSLREPHVIPDNQFDELVNYCYPLRFGTKGGELVLELIGGLRIWEELNQIEVNMEILTGISHLLAFDRARYATRPNNFQPCGGRLILDLLRTVYAASSKSHASLLCIGYHLGSITKWGELLDYKSSPQFLEIYREPMKESIDSALEFCELSKISQKVIEELKMASDSISRMGASNLRDLIKIASAWCQRIEVEIIS
jgi:hypothetical protein